MVFTYLVYLHFLGFKSVLFKKRILDYLGCFLRRPKECDPFYKRENCYLAASVPAECHIQGSSANSPQVCELRLSIHSEMCVA